jgi:hypothetical protein
VRDFLEVHFGSLLGVALVAAGVALCILDGSPHSGELGEKLIACGLLAISLRGATAEPKPPGP